jgi:hypothetical protein
MKLVVTAFVLSCGTTLLAQSNVPSTPVPKPAVTPLAPAQRPRIRQAGAPNATPGATKTTSVLPSAPVVTVKGVCKDKLAKGPCETVVTREDVDRFVNGFAPEATDTVRSRLAVQYARTIAFSSLAEQQSLDKNPALAKEIAAQVKLVRMRMLANAYLQNVQSKTAAVAEVDIQKYYEGHKDQYEQTQVRRLSVPIAVPTDTGRPLDRAAVKAEMGDIRKRAVAGEDLNQLQLDAYKHLHVQATPPPVNPIMMQRRSVQGEEAAALNLKPGEISEVLELPAAFIVMKVESKDAVPVGAVHQEIEAIVRRDRVQSEVSKLSKSISAQFNLQYLEMAAQPDLFGPGALNTSTTSRPVVRRTSTR